MKLIVGLGNPGPEYNFTRHNFGFLALDFYFKTHDLSWQTAKKFHSIYTKIDEVIFLKPQTCYNEVGLAAKECASFYKIPLDQIYVVCDDFNLEFGQLRFREKGSSGGNNGLKSMEQYFCTTDFPRLRLGSGNNELRSKIGDANFVLGCFTEEESNLLPEILQKASDKLDEIIKL